MQSLHNNSVATNSGIAVSVDKMNNYKGGRSAVKEHCVLSSVESISEENVSGSPKQCRVAVRLRNKHIDDMKTDVLRHLSLSTHTHDFKAMFGDVKFLCVGGSVRRMEAVAQFMMRELGLQLPVGQRPVNIISDTDRYVMFKVGPVLTVSHGIGIGSFSVVMHELIKLLYHANATDVTIFRLGTSGGIGLEPGTVVVSRAVIDTLYRNFQELHVLGKIVQRPAAIDQGLVDELLNCSKSDDHFQVIAATTMCALDFYEEQARLDGAFCDYTEQDKITFLRDAYSRGVRNMEMESICFAAMCLHAEIPGAVVCVTMLDRLQEDQVRVDKTTCMEWEQRPALIVSRFIRQHLGNLNGESSAS